MLDVTAQLIVAIGALWAVLSAVVGSAFKFLLDERKTLREEWKKERDSYEVKLDVASQVIIRQNDSMQKQIDSQYELVAQQQRMIEALQMLAKAPSS